MRLRLRYSLLTMLVFTALVAGGMKLWHGPHHVVERPVRVTDEVDYTFTRDWRGNKIAHGVFIQRFYKADASTLESLFILFYRHGQKLPWVIDFDQSEKIPENFAMHFLNKLELSPEEQLVCEQAILSERQRLAKDGCKTRGVFMKFVKDSSGEFLQYAEP